jgi:hypothetical protein
LDISKPFQKMNLAKPVPNVSNPYKMAGVTQNEAIRDAKCNSPALRRIMVEVGGAL